MVCIARLIVVELDFAYYSRVINRKWLLEVSEALWIVDPDHLDRLGDENRIQEAVVVEKHKTPKLEEGLRETHDAIGIQTLPFPLYEISRILTAVNIGTAPSTAVCLWS